MVSDLYPSGDRNSQVFRFEESFNISSPQSRERMGRTGLDFVQALVPAAGVLPSLLSDVSGWVFYAVFLLSFAVASSLYFGNVRRETEDSDNPMIGLMKSCGLGFGSIIVGQAASQVPLQWGVLCATALVGLTFANTRVVRELDKHVPEIDTGAPGHKELRGD